MGYCIAGIGNDDSADCYCIYSFTEKDHVLLQKKIMDGVIAGAVKG